MRVSRKLRHAKQSSTRRSLLPSNKQQPAKPTGNAFTYHTHRKGTASRLLAFVDEHVIGVTECFQFLMVPASPFNCIAYVLNTFKYIYTQDFIWFCYCVSAAHNVRGSLLCFVALHGEDCKEAFVK
eukprot:scaffold395132_cov33-Prasinocladus_malaysianus.AAC.1